jgi:hypothetical protein
VPYYAPYLLARYKAIKTHTIPIADAIATKENK